MENENTLQPNQSLQIIDEMVQRARFNFKKGSVFFIIWGILLSASAAYDYVAANILNSAMPYIGWPIAGMLGGFISFFYGARISKEIVGTHLDKIYSWIWLVFFATLAIFIVTLVSNRIEPGSYILILTGLPTFFTGLILRFRPLLIGGIGFWVIGIFSLYFFEEYRSIFFAIAIIQGYLIPGFLMMKKEA